MTPTPETSPVSPSRRTVLRAAAASALVPIGLAGGAGAAQAAGAGGHEPSLPPRVELPAGYRPEGITSGPGTTYYVGSVGTGQIVTGDLRNASGTDRRVLLPAAEGRSLRGLYWDRRARVVWAVGNVGAVSHVWSVRDRSGEVVSDTVVPGGGFLNDVVVARGRVWVTDSKVDRITVLTLGRDARPQAGPPTFLRLSGAWPAFNGTDNNANGIRALWDGSLILNNSKVGGLWRVDPRTGNVRQIPVTGGPAIVSGDGLELVGRTAYDVRGSGQQEVSVVRLDCGRSGWTGRWVTALTGDLDVPSTATYAAGSLWAVNARFGVASPTTAPYWITRLPTR